MKRQASILMALTLAACGGGADFTPANQPPVAIAGPNQTVTLGDTVTLAGSGADPEKDPLSYLWTFTRPEGSGASLTSTKAATPTFVPDLAGVYTGVLTVNDGKLTSAPSTVTFTVQPRTADFIKLWNGNACAETRRILVIDQHLVYTESHSMSCSDSNLYALYESTPERLLCRAGGISGLPVCSGGAAYATMMQTILANTGKADLGLGSTHSVQQVYALP